LNASLCYTTISDNALPNKANCTPRKPESSL
jgi:hypothetical protein